MLANKFLDLQLPEKIIVSDDEITQYYEKNQNEFKRVEDEVHLIQLYLEKLDPAISREIRASNTLLDIITKNFLSSQSDQLLEKNGDLGYVRINSLRPEIKRRISSATPGRIYGPINLENGNYYFQIKDRQTANSIRDLELVKEKIRMRLSLHKRENIIKDVLEKILQEYKVEIYSDHIK
jgi:parvulin-like peptidyl-prolyl isomerase